MAARKPLVRQGGQSRQLAAGDNIGLPRYYRMDTAPTDERVDGDEWTDTTSGITYKWFAGGSGQWVEWQPSNVVAGYSSTADIEVTDATKGLVLRSPNGTRWRITIDNAGTLTRTSL